MTLLIVILLVLLFSLGTPIFSVMILAGAYGATQTARGSYLQDLGTQVAEIFKLGMGEPAAVLSTIPLFIFMGFIMAEAKTADRLVRVAKAGLGWMPGGLAVVTIFACAVFTTFTGASGVTIVALGGLIMPSLLKEKYPEKFSLGLVAGTGSVGLLFPPALPLFVYGTVYGFAAQTQGDSGGGTEMQLIEFSTERFIFAGIVPGSILILTMCLYSVFVAKKNKVPRTKLNFKEFGAALLPALPEIAMPFLIIFSLTQGLTIAQVACLAVLYIMVLEILVFRDVPVTKLWKIVGDSMALVGAIFIIIFAASAFTNFLVTAEVPQMLFSWIKSTFHSKWTFLLALNIFLLFVGMTMDIFSAIVVVVPLISPVAKSYGIDPYHLGIIFLLNLELGYLTPPVGLNLFITSFTFKRPIDKVVRSVVPFLGCMVVSLLLVTYIPVLTTAPLDTFRPPERRGRVETFVKDVQNQLEIVRAVKEVKLPSGETVTLDSCGEIEDMMVRSVCESLFTEVTTCRDKFEGEELADCEKEAIEEYLENISDDLDIDDDDDDVDDDGGYGDEDEDEDDDFDYENFEDKEEGADKAADSKEEKKDSEGEDDDFDYENFEDNEE